MSCPGPCQPHASDAISFTASAVVTSAQPLKFFLIFEGFTDTFYPCLFHHLRIYSFISSPHVVTGQVKALSRAKSHLLTTVHQVLQVPGHQHQ